MICWEMFLVISVSVNKLLLTCSSFFAVFLINRFGAVL